MEAGSRLLSYLHWLVHVVKNEFIPDTVNTIYVLHSFEMSGKHLNDIVNSKHIKQMGSYSNRSRMVVDGWDVVRRIRLRCHAVDYHDLIIFLVA